MLTVKQLSDKLEVSKQTINNNVPDDMSYKKIKGINYIDSELEIAITNNINRNKNRFSYDSNQSDIFRHENTSSNDELIKQLRSEIDTLSNQLAVKDNQIEQITKALTNQQSLQLEHYRNNELDNTTQNISSNDMSIIDIIFLAILMRPLTKELVKGLIISLYLLNLFCSFSTINR